MRPYSEPHAGELFPQEAQVPYLIYLGTNLDNLSGTSAKGYWIRRLGTHVLARWGPVDAAGAKGGRYTWGAGGGSKEWSFRSAAGAKDFLQRKVREKEIYGYDRLPTGRKIEG